MTKKVSGVGVNDVPNASMSPAYTKWLNMLERCYNPYYLNERPTYIDCVVCPEWKLFSNFKAWYEQHAIEGYDLDKDLLVEGNKTYAPEYCRFIPPELNKLFNTHARSRGKYPQGVSLTRAVKNPYTAQIQKNGKVTYIGVFPTPEEASEAYETAKSAYVLEEVARYRTEGIVCTEILDAIEKRY